MRTCGWVLLTVALASCGSAAPQEGVQSVVAQLPPAPTSSHPQRCTSDSGRWPQPAGHHDPPGLVRRAMKFLPFLSLRQVVVLPRASSLDGYLRLWGYSQESIRPTLESLRGLAEFTIDHHFPVFINGDSAHYRRILTSWEVGRSSEEAAQVLASDLYHEYRHAACGEEEIDALKAQVALLEQWRAAGRLRIADPYLAAKRAALAALIRR